MRTTLNLNEELLNEAMRYSDKPQKTAVIHDALRAYIAREAAKELANMGGSEPQLKDIVRRRSTQVQ